MAVPNLSNAEAPLLLNETVDGCVDCRGRPVFRSSSGGWRSAKFIIGVEVAERFAYYGIQSNLITYLTRELGQSTATAAENVNAWSGTALMLPIVGAFVADSYLGRYRTIVGASLIYVLGLGLLTLSAILSSSSSTPDQFQVIFFLFSLYLVAVAQSGHKPCVQAFGADQFDGQDPEESKSKSSFFNWWYCGMCVGTSLARLILNYIQDNFSWALGFGIPGIAMVVALVVFLIGTETYRFSINSDKKNPFVRIFRVFVAAIRNCKTMPSTFLVEDQDACGTKLTHQSSEQFKFLNKALLAIADSDEDENYVCSINDVEDAKALLSLAPIWTTSLVYGIVDAQCTTFFTKQGGTMDRALTPGFDIPPATLQSFLSLTIIITMPIYDRVFVPVVRAFTRKPTGITKLQRIGTGLFFSISSMVVAALVEMKRLKIAEEFGLVDKPEETIPMKVWWLIPQYSLLGLAEAFTMVGLQELFYSQVPTELKSVGLSLYLSILGVGSFLSSFLISIIEKLTSKDGQDSWFDNNLNHGHLDYFYLLLTGLSVVGLLAHLYFSKSYIYRNGSVLVAR